METKQEILLCRVIANHLFLSQFEPFRACLRTLYEINPTVALGVLQAIIGKGGELKGILWSDSVPSSAHLTWLCLGELLALEGERKFSFRGARARWASDPQLIFDNVEFLLLVELLKRLAATRASILAEETGDKLWELGKEHFRRSGESISERSSIASSSGSGQFRKSEGISLGVGGRVNETFDGFALDARRLQTNDVRGQGYEASSGEGTQHGDGETSREGDSRVSRENTAETVPVSDKTNSEDVERDSVTIEFSAKEVEEGGAKLIQELSANGLERLIERLKLLDAVVDVSGIGENPVLETAQLGREDQRDSSEGSSTSKIPVPEDESSYKGNTSEQSHTRIKDPGSTPDAQARGTKSGEDDNSNFTLPEEQSAWVRKLTLYHPDLLDALSSNIRRQQHALLPNSNSDSTQIVQSSTDDPFQSDPGNQIDTSGTDDRVDKDPYVPIDQTKFETGEVLGKEVQNAHLFQIKEDIRGGKLLRASQHIRYLHDGFGVADSQYRDVMYLVMKAAKRNMDPGKAPRDRINDAYVLWIYEQVTASCSANLLTLAESAQDAVILEEVEEKRVGAEQPLPPPLEKLHNQLQKPRAVTSTSVISTDAAAIRTCKVDMFQYARVVGTHVLEAVMEAAFTAIKALQLQKAADVLAPFPRLQPLVTVMGWDLLSGNTSGRRRFVELFWTSRQKSGRLDGGSTPGRPGEEESCIEDLCHQLCYRLELAYFAALVNSGISWEAGGGKIFGNSRARSIGRNLEEHPPADPFVANLVLERLAMHSAIRVIFDVVPGIKFEDALELVEMQPIGASTTASWQRQQDLELLHMHFGIQAAVHTLVSIEASAIESQRSQAYKRAKSFLLALRQHLEAVTTPVRKHWMMSMIVHLLHMDELSLSVGANEGLAQCDGPDATKDVTSKFLVEEEKLTAVAFVGDILAMLRQSLSASVLEGQGKRKLKQNSTVTGREGTSAHTALPDFARKPWEQKISHLQKFVDDWEWRLAVLQRLSPSSQRQWQWKEALTVLRAAPSTLLNMCVQRAQYDLGEEAVHRFALPPEEAASLQLAEYVDGAVARSSVDDAVSHVADRSSISDEGFNLDALRVSPLASILLCLDVAAASASKVVMAKHLLDRARVLLSQITQGSQKQSNILEQKQEACLVFVTKRVSQRLQDLLEQDKYRPLQASLSGTDMVSSGPDIVRQGPRQRALGILQQCIEDAHEGKRQFLSGTLHNLGKAMASEDVDDNSKQMSSPLEKKQLSLEHVLGCGFAVSPKNVPVPFSGFGDHAEVNQHAVKTLGKRFLGPLSNKPTAYLSAFILYVATIGDIVDGVDTTHDYNFFSLVYERPNDLLTRLVFERGSADAAGKVAEMMGSDLVHQIITACVPPVYPPKGGKGWACIPRLPSRAVHNAGVTQRSSIHPTAPGEDSAELYPLQRDVIKHLATLSPVRAILACVFGSSRFTVFVKEGDGDSASQQELALQQEADRWFYEFALEQSDRYSTLNRWIQLQANLQRLSETTISIRRPNDADVHEEERRKSIKRMREPEADIDSEDEQDSEITTILGMQDPPPGWDGHQRSSSERAPLSSINLKTPQASAPFTVLLDWENEAPYEEAIRSLMEEGKLVDALALADRWLRDGAPDRLLQLLIEKEEGGSHTHQPWQIHGSSQQIFRSNSWQYCIRLRDKKLAATLALKHLKNWELDAAIDVLTMCSCHLDPRESLYEEVVRVKQTLQQYGRILRAHPRFSDWNKVEDSCQADPEGLALMLASKGAVSAALDVAESFNLPNVTRRELQGRQLVKLLTSDPTTGGGPAEGLRFLSSLQHPEDALAVAMAAMEQLPNLRSKQLLVHFFLKRRIGTLSEEEHARLDRLALGLRMLGALPLPWQQRCSALHEHPRLILETLLMWKQLKAASQLLEAFPKLRDDKLIIDYAAKAISFSTAPPVERRTFTSSATNKPASRMKSNISSGISSLQRRAFSWASKDVPVKVVPKEAPNRKRKGSMLPPSQIAAWEAMAGIPEDQPPIAGVGPQEGYERIPPVTMGDEWVLTGDPTKDDAVRSSHRYESAPSSILFKALLSLCSEEIVAAKAAVDLCELQIKKLLCAEQLPLNASSEVKERAFHATEAFVQALLHARAQLRNLAVGQSQTLAASSDTADKSERETGEEAAGQSSQIVMEASLTDKLPELLILADLWLSRVELLQSLLGAGVTASIDDLVGEDSTTMLRDRLIENERYTMAVHTCTKCKIDALPVWKAWGHALLRVDRYAQARVKFKQALRLLKGDPAPFVHEVISTIEAGPPVDVSAVRNLYVHTQKSVSSSTDDSLSAAAYLTVLYMPSFTRTDRSRRSSEDSVDSSVKESTHYNGDEPIQSNLDTVRYEECVYYLKEYARQDLLAFQFRHGRYYDACQLLFPNDSVPPSPPLANPTQPASSSSASKPDPLATQYGTVEDLFEKCVTYGAVNVLERILATRVNSQDEDVAEHTSLSLTRICNYCEVHRLFNHLYRFQVLKKDYVAAGLCCIQLYLNSTTPEEALRQLERARGHFDQGLAARQQAGDSSQVKSARGKLPSGKLTEEELIKFTARINIQMEVVRAFSDSDKPLWKWSLFGNPNDADTFQRRYEVAEALVEKNFDLAFSIIYGFQLPAVHIYAGVAASLAERKKSGPLSDLLKSIKGTIDEDDFDQVLGAAINVYATKRERPDKLIDMLSKSHRKVLACVICGRLKSAFQIASRSGTVPDVEYVAHQARQSGNLSVYDMCEQWLAKNA